MTSPEQPTPNPDAKRPKLKVFLLTFNDITCNLIFEPVFQSDAVEVVGVGYSEHYTPKEHGLLSAFKLLKRTDWRYWTYLAFINGFLKVYQFLALLTDHVCPRLPCKKWVCRKKNIPCYYPERANDPAFIEVIRRSGADLILMRVSQLMKSEILSATPYGMWCIHSSLLPAYKGISSEFHSIRCGENNIGTSVFQVVLKIDEGQVLRQCQMPIDLNRSTFWHRIQNNRAAGQMLRQCLEELQATGRVEPKRVEPQKPHSYHSWPSSADVNQVLSLGVPLIKLGEIWDHLLTCLHLRR